MEDSWLSLQEASRLLGVSTSTVRRWGDGGKLRMSRTAGGHRRFPRSAVASARFVPDHWASAGSDSVPRRAESHVAASWGVDRQQLACQAWRPRLTSSTSSERMRGLGQRLLGLLLQYVHDRAVDTRFLAEARAVGETYGREARTAGGSLHDVVEAFLFFRRSFSKLAAPLPGLTPPTELTEAVTLYSRMDHFMDAILLGAIAGYEG